MVDAKKSWIHVAVTKNGLRWPGRNMSADSAQMVRIAGRWISETEFQIKTGDVLVVPPPGKDGWREGVIDWRDPDKDRKGFGSTASIFLME